MAIHLPDTWKQYLLIFFFILPVQVIRSENIMRIDTCQSMMNDTIVIELNIENTEPFIAFQCDLVFPSNLVYQDNSATLTTRADGHILIESSISENHIRIFSYSNSNQQFSGHEGAVLKFKIYTGSTPGNYNIEIRDAIIGNDQSQNILTQTLGGYIQVSSNGLVDDQYQVRTRFYPNPVFELLFAEFELTEPSDIEIQVYNLHGDLEKKIPYGIMMPGLHKLNVPLEKIGTDLGGVKFICLETRSHHRVWRSKTQKIIVNNHLE